MRITYLHQYFTTPEFVGGSRSYEMARRLVSAGHEVTMITSSAFLPDSWVSGRSWSEVEVEGIRVLILPSGYSNKMSFSSRVIEFLRYAWRTTGRARTCPVDVVFATSTPLTVAIPGVLAARSQGVPLVFEVRDVWPDVPISIGALRNPLARRTAFALERWAYRNSQAIVALSSGMAAAIESKGVPRNHINVIPNAADLDLFTVSEKDQVAARGTHDWLGSRRMVLYAGTLGIINEVEYLAKLAARVLMVDPEIRFVVIGEGNRMESVRSVATQLGVIDRNFFLLAPMPKREVAAYVAAADLSLSLVADNPVLWNNSANKFFDTMAAGTAVGVNHGGWQAEIIEENGIGLVLDPRDLGQARDDLVAFLGDNGKIRACGRRAQELAQSRFSRDLLAAQLQQVIADAVIPEQ